VTAHATTQVPGVATPPVESAPAPRFQTRPIALRTTILQRTLPLLVIIWAIMAAWAYQDALRQTNQLFDAAMVQSAEVLFSLAHHEMEEIQQVGPHQDEYAKPLTFQVWDDRGHQVFHSGGAPVERLSPLDNGFSETNVAQEGWRVYAYHESNDTVYLLIGERLSVRRNLALRLALRTMVPFALALPLIAWVVVRSVGSALAPTEKVVHHLRELAASRLDPVSDDHIPLEIQPLVGAMNALFVRLRASYEHERRFTADAAHELRTPLAALKVNAQVLLNGEIDDERRRRLQRVVMAANRCEGLVAQLLTLARLEQHADQHPMKPVHLPTLAQEVVGELSAELLDKDIGIDLTPLQSQEAHTTVKGDREMLRILLRNLLDNALRYSPAGSDVSVMASPAETVGGPAGGTVLRVIDAGPGIPEALRQRAFDRFFRIPGNQGSGSGLGLSIVKRIAGLHGAELTLHESPGGQGLEVRLQFPGNEPGAA
jgi:two-component system sensor histidine kinase QseC